MPIQFNGVEVDNKSGDMVFNGVNLTEVRFDNTKVWEQRAAPGTQLFTASGTFTVPVGYTEVTICMCGGGGGGATGYASNGGGYAGQIISQTISVTEGQEINIIIGTGGAARGLYSPGYGYPGTSSHFGPVIAVGGSGGVPNAYAGVGNARSSCGGIFYDGTSGYPNPNGTYGGGGQAGAFGDGGKGASISYGFGTSGGVGAGGGGGGGGGGVSELPSTSGGRGQCVVSWS